jgi:hypothetical protein
MLLVDAGVTKFACPEFSVEFPPVVAAPPKVVLNDVKAGTPKGPEAPQGEPRTPYDHLFNGNKPKLGAR